MKPAQWISWNKAHDEWDAELSTRGMLLGQLSINKGWILSSEDLFSGARNIAALSQADAPTPTCKAAAVRTAKAKLEALKKRNANCCAAAAMVAADQDCINGARLIALACQAIVQEFSMLQTSAEGLTGVGNSKRFAHNWSQWGRGSVSGRDGAVFRVVGVLARPASCWFHDHMDLAVAVPVGWASCGAEPGEDDGEFEA